MHRVKLYASKRSSIKYLDHRSMTSMTMTKWWHQTTCRRPSLMEELTQLYLRYIGSYNRYYDK